MKVYRVVTYRKNAIPEAVFVGSKSEARRLSIKGNTEWDTFEFTYKYQLLNVLNDAVELGRAIGASVDCYYPDDSICDVTSGDMDRSE
jgi:hypothetical protein